MQELYLSQFQITTMEKKIDLYIDDHWKVSVWRDGNQIKYRLYHRPVKDGGWKRTTQGFSVPAEKMDKFLSLQNQLL